MIYDHLDLLKIKSVVDTFYIEIAVKGLSLCNEHYNSINSDITSSFPNTL